MIVVANDDYFMNLLCVYELAVFSNLRLGSELKDKLVLISFYLRAHTVYYIMNICYSHSTIMTGQE